MYWGDNFFIEDPITRVLKKIVYYQTEWIIPVSKFTPHWELPIVVMGTTIHQSHHITNLPSFSDLNTMHLFYLDSFDRVFFAFIAVARGMKHI